MTATCLNDLTHGTVCYAVVNQSLVTDRHLYSWLQPVGCALR